LENFHTARHHRRSFHSWIRRCSAVHPVAYTVYVEVDPALLRSTSKSKN
jgi:hypothetical protein